MNDFFLIFGWWVIIAGLGRDAGTQYGYGAHPPLTRVLETLVTRDVELSYVPELAKSWNVSNDGLIWTFELREGVKFHDGTDFNAEVVKQNLIRVSASSPDLFGEIESINVIDDYNREGLLVEPGTSLPASRITNLLDQKAVFKGSPDMIRVDNGPELRSSTFINWAQKHNILIQYIQPGKPAQNGFIEGFNRTYREEVLDMNLFNNLAEVKEITKIWLEKYNNARPHESLNGLAPIGFAKKREELLTTGKQKNSTFRQY